MRTSARLVLALALGFLFPLLAGPPASRAASSGDAAEEPPPPPPAEAVVPSDIPESARRRQNPIPPARDSLVRGEWIFTSHCAMCHGARGDGTGELVDRLGLTMPDLTDPRRQAARTDGELFYIISTGHGRMPPHSDDFPEEYRWDLVNHIRTLKR